MEWVIKYGYLAVFLGALVEGESVILTAGVLCYQGYMSLWKIMVVSFIATLIADQTFYHLGRAHGAKLLKKWPKLAVRSEKAFDLLHRYNTLFILSCRFIYGIRTISPAIIGMAGVSVLRFTILNVIAAVIWSVLSCSAGYLLGYVGQEAWDHMKASGWGYWWLIPVGLLVLIIGGTVLWRRWRGKRQA